ncbi:hypothetical protein DY000_02041627 [Brassica cretica]|uniref:Uncharacterized protein n=1 Tax=Brassica cretica TaxID=69181 RepID=A0ABQ7BE12_BRACR|nr:hypothetical protein DY000_02041627 [Brassica cretica]
MNQYQNIGNWRRRGYDRYEATTETVANRRHVPQTTTSLFLLLPLSVVVVAVRLKLREVAIERDGD